MKCFCKTSYVQKYALVSIVLKISVNTSCKQVVNM